MSVVVTRSLLINQRCCKCPKTYTMALPSISNRATCTQCLPLFTYIPTYPLTHAYSVQPGPCNGNQRSTSSTPVSSYYYILFMTAAYVPWCPPPLPLSWLWTQSKLGDSSLCFVNAKISIPALCHFSICTKILHCSGSYMYVCDTYITLSLPLLTSQLV